MPMVNWDKIKDSEYTLIPDGDYAVIVQEVVEKNAKTGIMYWDVEFMISDGDFAGHKLHDKLFFSEKALNRVKMACHRLGVNTTGEYDFQPHTLIGRTCILTVLTEEYRDNNNTTKQRNLVPYDGYKLDDSTTRGVSKPVDPKDDTSNLPF